MPAADKNASTLPGTITPPPDLSPAGAPLGGPKSAEKQYEFKPNENKIISQLAFRMHFVGLFLLATGLVVIGLGVVNGGHIVHHIGPIISGSLMCLVGIWTQRASMSFKSVVQTEGKDISFLMYALEDLRKLYSLQFWLFIVLLLLSLIIFWLVSLGKIPWIF